ncbi:MAG: 50S ribosomal protein L25/general stress protein Ctc [Candidatus Magnetomorum sp.]|nr:50S ribosomal protein L25/general stress protein Ctc [Candidatus Magnetomorum sp.]
MEFIDLNATKRTRTGKGAARKLRQSEHIPAILYGQKMAPEALTLSTKELDLIFRKHGRERLFFNLIIDGNTGDSRKTLLKELQANNVTGSLFHMDLHQVDMEQTLHITVPLVTTGKSKGVEAGGLLQLVRRKLEIICLPVNIPDKIEVDVTDIDIGDSIHVSELALPSGVIAPHDVDFTIVTVLQPKGLTAEEEGAEEEGEEETEVAPAAAPKKGKES